MSRNITVPLSFTAHKMRTEPYRGSQSSLDTTVKILQRNHENMEMTAAH